jgi:hypothetical protein
MTSWLVVTKYLIRISKKRDWKQLETPHKMQK